MSELEELKLAYAECSRQRNELLNKLKSQAQRTWVGLTDEGIIEWVESGEYNVITNDWASHIEFARAIEAKLKEKNT